MTPAPTGRVTLVFTDVQGSTQLWEEDSEVMAQALDMHNQILRELIDDHGGYEVKTEGDAFMVAFAHPKQAINWCLAAQIGLHSADWPVGLEELSEADSSHGWRGLRVRMGGHIGEPSCQADPVTGRMDYFGPMVNRAARIGNAGHGGQIVFSQAVVEGIDEQEQGLRTPLGSHQLKGLRNPEPLVQIDHPELPSRVFPPLRTLSARRHNLPPETNELMGRSAEVKTATRAWESGTRALSLIGPGGAGKTRLALHLAHRIESSMSLSGGTWWVDLSHTRDTAEVLIVVAERLHLPLPTSASVPERVVTLGARLAGLGPAAVMLDNAEQVAAEVGRLLKAWLAAAPELRFVLTSRVRLRVPSEVRIAVGSLPMEAGVQLLVNRAQEVQTSFALSDHQHTLAEQLVQRLDGWPLAIELAAARLSTLTLDRVLKRLDQRFRLLGGVSDDRQDTLHATIDWSWQLLTQSERRVLMTLTVFHGPFSNEDVESVFGDDPTIEWIEDTLDALVAHSLLTCHHVNGVPTFNLYQSVKAFAADELARHMQGSPNNLLERHARWAATWGRHGRRWQSVEPLTPAAMKSWRVRRSDIQAAHTWAGAHDEGQLQVQLGLALAGLCLHDGPFEQGLGVVEAALRLDTLSGPDEIDIRCLHVVLLTRAGRFDDAISSAEVGLKVASTDTDRIRMLLVQVGAFRRGGRIHEAETLLAQAHALLSPEICPELEGHLYNTLGIVASHRTDQVNSEQYYRRAHAIFVAQNMPWECAMVLQNLGGELAVTGRASEARSAFSEGLAVGEHFGQLSYQTSARGNMALLECRHGSITAGWDHALAAEAIARRIGDNNSQALSLSVQAFVLQSKGQLEEASQANLQAIEFTEQIGSLYWYYVYICDQALLRAQQNHFEEANALLDEAEAGFKRLGDPGLLARAVYARGRIALLAGDHVAAQTLLTSARDQALAHGQALEATQALSQLGQLAWRQGESELAESRLRQAAGEGRNHELWSEVLEAELKLGVYLAGTERVAEAIALMRSALALAESTDHRLQLALCLAHLGEVLMDEDETEEAEALLDRAAATYLHLGLLDQQCGVRCTQARLALKTGDLEQAEAYARRALQDADTAKNVVREIDAHCVFAQVLQARKRPAGAREQISMARTLAQDHDLAGHPAVILALSRLDHSEAAGGLDADDCGPDDDSR